MKIKQIPLFTLVFLLFQVFNVVVLGDLSNYNTRVIYGTLFLLFVPGWVTLLALKTKIDDFWKKLVFSVGVGVFILMLTGFITNQLAYLFNVVKPLTLLPLMTVFNVLLLILFEIAYIRNKRMEIKIKIPKLDYINLFLVISSLFFPFISSLGAIALNNNQDNPYTATLLGVIGGLILYIFLFRTKITRSSFVIFLYSISLSLLLMTSLRGWYTTGHDNQMEYFVFQLSKSDQKWDITEYRDPYNASLSITILPTVLQTLLNINDLYIYKLIYQIIFAFAPVAIYLFFEKYSDKVIAFMAVLMFLSFPTYINDMPMLNRQEIATLFFALLLLLIFSGPQVKRTNRILFLILGFGMVVSHYSTNYIAITLFAFVYFVNLILSRIKRFKLNRFAVRSNWKRISLPMIAVLSAFTFYWNVQLTNTTAGLTRVVSETYKNIGKTFSQDLKSGGVTYSFFSFSSLDKKDLLKDYQETFTERARQKENSNQLFSENITENYKISQINEYKTPETYIGNYLKQNGISPFDLNYFMRQMAAKLVQLFLIIGAAFILFKKTKTVRKTNPEYIFLVIGNMLTIAFFIVLPVLSLEYGAQRLFQQSLVVSALPLVVGFVALFGFPISALITLVLFLSLSGLIPFITGGYNPQLHMENRGSYYDSFLTHDSEYYSMTWLSKNYSENYDVYASAASRIRMVSTTGVFAVNGILPSMITFNDYVYLNNINVKESKDVVSYKGDLIYYKLPLNFYDDYKDKIYDNSETRIYK